MKLAMFKKPQELMPGALLGLLILGVVACAATRTGIPRREPLRIEIVPGNGNKVTAVEAYRLGEEVLVLGTVERGAASPVRGHLDAAILGPNEDLVATRSIACRPKTVTLGSGWNQADCQARIPVASDSQAHMVRLKYHPGRFIGSFNADCGANAAR